MIDWTPVATAAIAASAGIGGALLGYLTALSQGKAELGRVQLEHGEKHLEHRQGVYHDFLDSAHRFHQSFSIEPFMTPGEIQKWARTFEHNLTAVSLFGTTEAWRAAQKLADVIGAAQGDAIEGVKHYDDKHEPEFLTTWEEAIRAMRPDTAPQG